MLRSLRDVDTVRLEVLGHNTVAHRLYVSLGFEETGRKQAAVVRNGAPVDSIMMARRL